MSFFDNKDKHLLSPDQELTFLGILSECERNADYFTSETYQEVIFDNFHEYINFYISKKKPLLNIIIEAYLRSFNVAVHIELFIDWILSHKHLNVNAQDSFGNSPLHIIALSRFGKGYLSYTPYISKVEQRLLDKGADPQITNQAGLTPYQIEQMIVKKIMVTRRKSRDNFKELTIEERLAHLKERYQMVSKIEDLTQIIKDFYLLIKKNDKIIIASKETKKIKEKVIQMAINEPEDYFDYDCYRKNQIKTI